jgi:hypothetical protein
MRPTRRQFLGNTVGSGLALGFLSKLAPVSGAEAKLEPGLVKLDDSIEPTVRLLEQTPRERVLEEVAVRIRSGLTYREVLTALMLAGVRNVQPRPQVGFKFHAVLVINSAHLASMSSPAGDRWLPIFWAIDRFKSSQLETEKTSGWRMSAVNQGRVPAADKARQAFTDAMDNWDEAAADAAAAALARTASRDECFELFARYGARDFRDIGHKAIYTANSFRTLDAIGWHHAEPVLRSLAYAQLKYDGPVPSKSDAAPDRPGRRNAERVKAIQPEWRNGKPDVGATKSLLETFRTSSEEEAPAAVVDALNHGVAADSVWDAILAAAGELLMRKTNILTLHAVTSANALHYAFKTTADPESRLMLLLQNAAFLPLFRQGVGEKNLSSQRLDAIEPAPRASDSNDPLADIFAEAGHDRLSATGKTLAYLQDSHDAPSLMHAARRLVFLKGNDAHDYKFSSAVLEDYFDLSPQWRDRYLAAAMFYLPGSGAPDNALVQRIRAAFSA